MNSLLYSATEAQLWLEKALQNRRAIVFCDSNTTDHCLPKLQVLAGLPTFVMEAGEEAKSIATVENLLAFMLDHRISRNDVLINLGGGVVCDLGGFTASIYKRGIECINIPTTLLAMVDAAIGGKTAVNIGSLRNMCGTFALPKAVLIFPSMLESLPPSELLSGTAEMLKHAILQDHAAFEAFIQSSVSERCTAESILQSAEFKQQFVANDLHDRGRRQLLNAGHTVAHAIESAFLKRKIAVSHGFAVAAGLWVEAELAMQTGEADAIFVSELKNYIESNFPKLQFDSEFIGDILVFMEVDKKNDASMVFCLPFSSGNVQRIEIAEIKRVENALIAYSNA